MRFIISQIATTQHAQDFPLSGQERSVIAATTQHSTSTKSKAQSPKVLAKPYSLLCILIQTMWPAELKQLWH